MLSAVRNFVLISATLISLNAAGETLLERRFGLGAFGGASIPTASVAFRDSTATGYAAGARLTYSILNSLGVDLSWNHLQFSQNLGNTMAEAFGANVHYRIMETSDFTPTIGGGGGYGITTNSFLGYFNFSNAYVNAEATLDYSLTPDWIVSLGAKYFCNLKKTTGTIDK